MVFEDQVKEKLSFAESDYEFLRYIVDKNRKSTKSHMSLVSLNSLIDDKRRAESKDKKDFAEDLSDSDEYDNPFLNKANKLWKQFLFLPTDPVKIKWDILIIILSIYNSIQIPFALAHPGVFDDIQSMSVVDRIVDVLFACDIIVNMRSCFIDKTDTLITDPYLIRKHYIQGRFWIDVCASFPFEILLIGNKQQVQLFGMLKLIRLMRLGRMVTYLKTNKSFKLGIVLIQLLFMLILVIHWIACLWMIIVDYQAEWMPPKDVDWGITDLYTSGIIERYNIFFYYSILTLVTNDLFPINSMEISFSLLILLFGSIFLGVSIGEFTSILTDMNERAQKVNEQLDLLMHVMQLLNLPEEIQLVVLNYYEEIQVSKYVLNEQVYMYLNNCVEQEIKLFQIEEAVIMSKIIREDNENIIRHFTSAFKIEFYQESEIIVKQNEPGKRFYLILEGIVEVLQEKLDFLYFDFEIKNNFIQKMQQMSREKRLKEEKLRKSIFKLREELLIKENAPQNQEKNDVFFKIVNELGKYSFFGEIALMSNMPRTSTVCTVNNCFFATMEKSKFLDLVKSYPQINMNLKEKMSRYKCDLINQLELFLRNVSIFRNLKHQTIHKLMYKLKPRKFYKFEQILKTGELSDEIFFLSIGEVQVLVQNLQNKQDYSNFFCKLRKGACFNLIGAILERPALFDYICGSNLDEIQSHYENDQFKPEMLEQYFKFATMPDSVNDQSDVSLIGSKFNTKDCISSPKDCDLIGIERYELYSISLRDLLEIEETDEQLHTELQFIRDKYLKQHIKYDFYHLLFKQLSDISLMKQKNLQNKNQPIKRLLTVDNLFQLMRLQMVRKKLIQKCQQIQLTNVDLSRHQIFKMVDKVYHKFVGYNQNIPLSLVLHNGVYCHETQVQMFNFIRLLQVKNQRIRESVQINQSNFSTFAKVPHSLLDLEKNSSKSFMKSNVVSQEKMSELDHFIKQIKLDNETQQRYNSQKDYLYSIKTKPKEATMTLNKHFKNNVNKMKAMQKLQVKTLSKARMLNHKVEVYMESTGMRPRSTLLSVNSQGKRMESKQEK